MVLAFDLAAPARTSSLQGSGRPVADGSSDASRQDVRTEVVDTARYLEVEAAFRALANDAPEGNAFLEPALLDAAQRATPDAPIVVLLAWDARQVARLVGAWAFVRRGRLIRRLHAPAAPFASLATPVIRAGWAEIVLANWFALIQAHPDLPKLLELTPADEGGETGSALDRLVAEGRCLQRIVARHCRPMLESNLPPNDYLRGSLSKARRSKLRQLRARLLREGEVRHVRHEGAAVPSAVEQFLALEAKGWKGRRGSALSADARDAVFVREAVTALAKRDLAAVTALTLDSRPISMCLLLRSGHTAFTWKITYDEAFGTFSPGYQLAVDDTTALLDDPRLARTDSCAADATGIMSKVWVELARAAEMFIDVRPEGTLCFALVMAALAVVRLVPELRRRLRLRSKLNDVLRPVRARFRAARAS
ncbi:MAG TPA: GNAT family N-acetyltransferase [Beijerinckiaceae bacterium]|jgi:CelD/BcsL family acetyltransferase involved in cellulose biosynthesis